MEKRRRRENEFNLKKEIPPMPSSSFLSFFGQHQNVAHKYEFYRDKESITEMKVFPLGYLPKQGCDRTGSSYLDISNCIAADSFNKKKKKKKTDELLLSPLISAM